MAKIALDFVSQVPEGATEKVRMLMLTDIRTPTLVAVEQPLEELEDGEGVIGYYVSLTADQAQRLGLAIVRDQSFHEVIEVRPSEQS